MRVPRRGTVAICIVLLIATTSSRSEEPGADLPSVTPYRPSVSTPATLSAPGWLEVEAGLLQAGIANADPRESLPYSLKLAFSADWGIRVGGEALVRSTGAQGEAVSGFGDTSVVLKRRFAVNDHSAFGLELGASFPTARAELASGSGGTELSINGIYSADLRALHADLNLLVTHVARAAADASREQVLYAAALSGNLNRHWGIVAELSGTHQGGIDPTAQLLCAASYSPARRITWDGGLAKGFLRGASSWSLFLGATALLGRVF